MRRFEVALDVVGVPQTRAIFNSDTVRCVDNVLAQPDSDMDIRQPPKGIGMTSKGYHAGIAGSKRSKATWMVAIAFAMVISLLASLDRPTGLSEVTQLPLCEVSAFMSARA